jgi:hypothetical protein
MTATGSNAATDSGASGLGVKSAAPSRPETKAPIRRVSTAAARNFIAQETAGRYALFQAALIHSNTRAG